MHKPALLLALLALAGCESVTAPDTLAVVGYWVGTHSVMSCTGGTDARACPRLPRSGSVALDADVSRTTVSGMLTIAAPNPEAQSSGTLTPVALPVSGTIDSSGVLHLKGSAPYAGSCPGPETITLTDWVSTVSNRAMTGSAHVASVGVYFGFCYPPQRFEIDSTFVLTSQAYRR